MTIRPHRFPRLHWRGWFLLMWVLALGLLVAFWLRSDSLSDAYNLTTSTFSATVFTHQGTLRMIVDEGDSLSIDDHHVNEGWNGSIPVPEEENFSSLLGRAEVRLRTDPPTGTIPTDLFVCIPFWLILTVHLALGVWLLRSIRRFLAWTEENLSPSEG